MLPAPPRPPVLPYTTLFRSAAQTAAGSAEGAWGAASLRRAVIMGSTLASFCVEAFSLDRLLRLTRAEIDARFRLDRKSTRLHSSHLVSSYAVSCLKKQITIL